MSEPEMKRLLAWFVAQCEGDSGTGASFWEQFPEFCRALEMTKQMNGKPVEIPVALSEGQMMSAKMLQGKLSDLMEGMALTDCIVALAATVAIAERMCAINPALFDAWLDFYRSITPKAVEMMERVRRNN